MTKREIAIRIADELDLSQLLVLRIVQRTLDSMTEALVTEGRIELRNFGVFEVVERRARKARNPKTGETVMVPARKPPA